MRVVVQERAGSSIKRLAKAEPLKKRAVEEKTVSSAIVEEVENVKRMVWDIG
jgi:hypothetical protein